MTPITHLHMSWEPFVGFIYMELTNNPFDNYRNTKMNNLVRKQLNSFIKGFISDFTLSVSNLLLPFLFVSLILLQNFFALINLQNSIDS